MEDPQILQIEVRSNHDPCGQGLATMVDESFTYECIGKVFKNLLKADMNS